MGVKEKLIEFKNKYAARAGAAGFMYTLAVYGVSPLLIVEPTRTFYSAYKTTLRQPELNVLLEGSQYFAFWWAVSHVGGGLAAILGFAAGPKIVDQIRRPVDWAAGRIKNRMGLS